MSAVEELLMSLGSGVAGVGSLNTLDTLAVLEMTVPAPPVTSYVARKMADSPRAKFAIVQTVVPELLPPLGLAQLKPGPEIGAKDENVVFAGMLSDTWTVAASLGPPLVTCIENVT
jgi:hypothetical protein